MSEEEAVNDHPSLAVKLADHPVEPQYCRYEVRSYVQHVCMYDVHVHVRVIQLCCTVRTKCVHVYMYDKGHTMTTWTQLALVRLHLCFIHPSLATVYKLHSVSVYQSALQQRLTRVIRRTSKGRFCESKRLDTLQLTAIEYSTRASVIVGQHS